MIASLTAVIAVLLAVAVVGGAVVAVSTRGPRLAVLGLLVALLAAPFVAEPLPDLRGIASRIAGAVLAAYPLLIAVRGSAASTTGSRGGWPADALLAVTAAVAAGAAAAGWDVAGSLGAGPSGEPGSIEGVIPGPYLPAIAAGAAVVALAVGPVGFARDPLRLTIGLCLGMLGLTLVQAALSGPPSAFTDLCVAVLLATMAGGGALLTGAARRQAAAGVAGRGPGPLPRGATSRVTEAWIGRGGPDGPGGPGRPGAGAAIEEPVS